MKYGFAVLSLLLCSASLAREKNNWTDYSHIIPRFSMSLEEARRMIPQIDAEKAKVGDQMKVLVAEKLSMITPMVQKKDQVVRDAHQAIARCQKEASCVAQVNTQLAKSIDEIHKALADINTKYNELIGKEQEKVKADTKMLEQILLSLQGSVLSHVIENEIMKKDGLNGIVVETGLVFQTTSTAEETDKLLNKVVYNRDQNSYWGAVWMTSELRVYSFATYFFRTPQEQKKVFLTFNFNHHYEYDKIRAELVSSKAETDQVIFGLSKAVLAKSLIEDMKSASHVRLDCLGRKTNDKASEKTPGKPEEKIEPCVSPLHLDTVRLN